MCYVFVAGNYTSLWHVDESAAEEYDEGFAIALFP